MFCVRFQRIFFRNITSINESTRVVNNNNHKLTLVSVVPQATSTLQDKLEDLSQVTPYFQESFNLATYVNKSELLQNLLHLGVDLNKIEKKKTYAVEKLLRLDFDNNIKQHVMFLKDYVEDIGKFVTNNPMILCEPIENLKVRVNYLKSKNFSDDQIHRIVAKNAFWLMLSTQRIDRRLGYFQKSFQLSGQEVRHLASRQPKIITYNLHHIKTNSFVIKEEMGFDESEIKKLILVKPKLWMIIPINYWCPSLTHMLDRDTNSCWATYCCENNMARLGAPLDTQQLNLDQKALLERFNYIHNILKISHETILLYPGILLCRNFKVKQRHLFLEKLGRAQYNPKKENYVPITALFEDTDTEFSRKYAKCYVSDFNSFLKTI